MRSLACIVFLLLFCQISFARNSEVTFFIKLKSDLTGQRLHKGEVQVYQSGRLVKSTISDSIGHADVKGLDINQLYVLKFCKSGYITKTATFDTHVSVQEYDFYGIMEVSLFKPIQDRDFSFLNDTPIVKFSFNADGEQQYDKDYTTKMLDKIDFCKIGLSNQKITNYFEHFDSALILQKNGQFEQAIQQFNHAKILIDSPSVNKYLKACEVAFYKKREREIEDKFNAIVVKADEYFNEKSFKKALELYQLAIKLKPNNKYLKSKIKSCQDQLTTEEKIQIKYNNYVFEGDEAFDKKNFKLAKQLYEKAEYLKSHDYTIKQIERCNTFLNE